MHLFRQQMKTQDTRDITERMYRGVKMAGQDKRPFRSRLMAIRISSMKTTNCKKALLSRATKLFRCSLSFLLKKQVKNVFGGFLSCVLVVYLPQLLLLYPQDCPHYGTSEGEGFPHPQGKEYDTIALRNHTIDLQRQEDGQQE